MKIWKHRAAVAAEAAVQVDPPTEYYTSRYSGEEIDKGIDGALQLGGASTPQGAIAALGAGVRPKLNDNPFFLVNQRGQSSYTGPGYGPDRWMVTGSHKLDMLDGGGVKLTVASGSNANQMIQQYLEPEIFEQLNGKQVTLAVIVTENSMSLPTYFRVGATTYGNIPAGQTGLFFATATINYKTGQNYIGFQCSDRANQNGQSISLRAFTAEEGSIQTLGYQDRSGVLQLLEHPDPLETLKCEKYQYIISTLTFSNYVSKYAYLGTGIYITSSQARIFIPIHVLPRIRPTLTYNGAFIVSNGKAAYNVSNITLEHISRSGISVMVNTGTGAMAGDPAMLRIDNDEAARIIFDANLS